SPVSIEDGHVILKSSQSDSPNATNSVVKLRTSKVRLMASMADIEYPGFVPRFGAISKPDCGLVSSTNIMRHVAARSSKTEKTMPTQPTPKPIQTVVRTLERDTERCGSRSTAPMLM